MEEKYYYKRQIIELLKLEHDKKKFYVHCSVKSIKSKSWLCSILKTNEYGSIAKKNINFAMQLSSDNKIIIVPIHHDSWCFYF